MKKKTRFKIENAETDFKEIRAYGYHVHQFQPWHYRISNPDYETRVDVWPTTHKLWKVDSGYTAIYKDGELIEKVNKIFAQEDLDTTYRHFV